MQHPSTDQGKAYYDRRNYYDQAQQAGPRYSQEFGAMHKPKYEKVAPADPRKKRDNSNSKIGKGVRHASNPRNLSRGSVDRFNTSEISDDRGSRLSQMNDTRESLAKPKRVRKDMPAGQILVSPQSNFLSSQPDFGSHGPVEEIEDPFSENYRQNEQDLFDAWNKVPSVLKDGEDPRKFKSVQPFNQHPMAARERGYPIPAPPHYPDQEQPRISEGQDPRVTEKYKHWGFTNGDQKPEHKDNAAAGRRPRREPKTIHLQASSNPDRLRHRKGTNASEFSDFGSPRDFDEGVVYHQQAQREPRDTREQREGEQRRNPVGTQPQSQTRDHKGARDYHYPSEEIQVDPSLMMDARARGYNPHDQLRSPRELNYTQREEQARKYPSNYRDQVTERIFSKSREQEKRLHDLQRYNEENLRKREMEECTFQPNLQDRNGAKGPSRRKSPPSQFHDRGEQFKKKKLNWIEQKNEEIDQRDRELREKRLMSDHSRQLLKEKGGAYSKSFLDRNYYRPQAIDHNTQRVANKQRLNSATSAGRQQQSQRPGSGMNHLNMSGASGYEVTSDRMFSPQINERSRRLSPRAEQSQTFQILHEQAMVQKKQRERAAQEAQTSFISNINKSILENVNEKSDAALVRAFHEEFNSLIRTARERKSTLFLFDILERLGFIDEGLVKNPQRPDEGRDRFKKLRVLLMNQRSNIMVISHEEAVPEDIHKNLFKVFCAILNLRPNQRGFNVIDDGLLLNYLDQVNTNQFYTDNNILNQFQVVKSLVNRKEYSLTDKQMKQIHFKFKNLFYHRKERVHEQKKAENERRISQERYHDYKYKPNGHQTQSRSDLSNSRGQHLYNQAEVYRKRQEDLRNSYQREAQLADQSHPYKPELNPNSIKMAEQSRREMADRSMEHYKKWQERKPRDPSDIEYEKNKDHLTFKPHTNPYKPNRMTFNDKRPANQDQERNEIRANPVSAEEAEVVISETQKLLSKQSQRSNRSSRQVPSERNARPPAVDYDNEEGTDDKSEPTAHFREQPAAPGGAIQKPSPTHKPDLIRPDSQAQQPNSLKHRTGPSQDPPHSSFYQGQDPSKEQQAQGVQEGPELICVLKIELDGKNSEQIRVYSDEDPRDTVDRFGDKFNISESGKERLLEQIMRQIDIKHRRV